MEDRKNLSVNYGILGSISQAQGQLDEAGDWFRQALAIHKVLAEEIGTVEARRDLSVSCDKLGDIARSQGRLDEAGGWYRQALAIRKVLAEETGTAESLDDLAVSYYNLGTLNGINRELIQQAYNICAQLVQARPNVSRYRKNLGVMEKLLKR